MFSIVLPRSDIEREAGQLPLLIGVSVAHAVASMTRLPVRVKWPNDVYLDDRKLCGILIESSAQYEPERSDAYIIGIGINCTVEFDQAPEEVRRHAVSLHQVLANRDQEQASCESVLLGFLRSWFDLQEVCASEPDWIERNWPAWDWLADREIQVQQPSRTWHGRADGIGSDGSLRLIDSQAIRHTILSGTVRVLE
jgi:BirA family biotin operon repressor/biotin-[acetyl-CoA-carboxylase] ligase